MGCWLGICAGWGYVLVGHMHPTSCPLAKRLGFRVLLFGSWIELCVVWVRGICVRRRHVTTHM